MIIYYHIQFVGILHYGGVKTEVAMKYTPSESSDMIIREYEMYSYLNAVNNESVEVYGIPAVFYYGRWEDRNREKYHLLAITLLESEFAKIKNQKDIDLLILVREFVSESQATLNDSNPNDFFI